METLQPAALGSNDMRVYEFGVRMDRDCTTAADSQVRKARALYNAIIACMRGIYDEMQDWVMQRSGEEGRMAHARVESLNEQFSTAKAANDEITMKTIAAERREAWKAESICLGAVRKQHAAELRVLFYSRIGRNSTQEPYRIRCAAVEDGLGWATANDVLDRALDAWKASMKMGRPPMFTRGDDKMQDSLVLQFTTAGGVDVARICDGSHAECAIVPPATIGPRQYGSFRFRLGSGDMKSDATGTVQLHRTIPPSAVTGARLVRRRHANKMKWALQLILRLRDPVSRPGAPSATLVCVHFGWAADTSGRRVAGIAGAADPGLARLVQLPQSIEEDLLRAAEIQSARDVARDEAAPLLKQLAAQDHLLPSHIDDEERAQLSREMDSLRRLPVQYIAAKRFYVLQAMLRRHGVPIDWLSKWVAHDRKQWQASIGVARRARLRRREFYRAEALSLARTYSAIVLETIDLKAAAVKIDEKTGERSEFAKKARSGRVVASIYEFEQELRKAAGDYGRAVFDLTGEMTIRRCASCGAATVVDMAGSSHEVTCTSCGAIADRKRHGAAMAWQISSVSIAERIVDFHAERSRAVTELRTEREERKQKMADGRRAARAARAGVPSDHGESTRKP